MAVSVVANEMPGVVNCPCDLRTLPRVFPDQEEGSFGSVLCQHVEQAQSVRIIGAIVIGERHLSGISAMSAGAPVELRPWRHGRISGIAGSSGRDGKSCES